MDEILNFGSTFCQFDARCITMANESKMCPRHEFMSKQLGSVLAVRIEYGLRCKVCNTLIPDEQSSYYCSECETDTVCETCNSVGACCQERSRLLLDEAIDAENDAADLQDLIADLLQQSAGASISSQTAQRIQELNDESEYLLREARDLRQKALDN